MSGETLTPEGRRQVGETLDRAIAHQQRTITEHEAAVDRYLVAYQDVRATLAAMLQARRRLKEAVERARAARLI